MEFVWMAAVVVVLFAGVALVVRQELKDRTNGVAAKLEQLVSVAPESRNSQWREFLSALHADAVSFEKWRVTTGPGRIAFVYDTQLRARVEHALGQPVADDVGLSAATDLRLDELLRSFSRPKPLQVQDSYLASLRGNSCYPVVRQVHGIVVILAVIGNVLFLFAGLSAASNTGYGIFGQHSALVWGIAAAMAFGIFIERALFVAILDAVDVMVDNARYQRQRDQQPPKAS